MTEAEALDRRLAEGYLRIQRWEYGSRHFHRGNPCVYTGAAIFGVIGLFLRPFAPFEERLGPALDRMAAIPALLRQGRANVREAPAAWVARAVQECDGALVFLGEGIELLPQEHARKATPAVRGVVDAAAAAFAEFRGYLERDLAPGATAEYSCGREALDLPLREGHRLEESVEAIAAYAEDRIAACEAYLDEHAAAFGARTWHEALAQLADRHPPSGAYYARFAEVWAAARVAAEDHRLVTWPDAPIRYVPQPYRDRAGATPAAAHAEAVKNSMFPGAALMYMTGTDRIHALRRTLSAQPGFDLCAFHDRLLSFGSIPVALIAAVMQSTTPAG